MSKQDQKKLGILVVLLGVLALIIVLGNRMSQPGTPSAVQASETPTKPSTNLPAAPDATLRLDLADKPEGGEDIGKKNVFEYQQTPPPPTAAQRGPSFVSSAGNVGPVALAPRPPVTSPGPAAPPPLPLKYLGYLILDTPGGGFTAVISDDQRHYNVTAGEVLMGRYRILAVSDKVVDVEDLEFHRRQSLPLVK